MAHPYLEVLRSQYHEELLTYLQSHDIFKNRSDRQHDRLTENLLLRWYVTQLDDDNSDDTDTTPYDPFFPYSSFTISEGMLSDLRYNKVPEEKIPVIQRGLVERSRRFIDELNEILPTLSDDYTITIKPNRNMMDVTLDYQGQQDTVSVHRDYYQKLVRTYNGPAEDRDKIIYSLLKRYQTLGGLNYQSAIPESVFDLLKNTFNITHEAFASPINRNINFSFSSLYPDIDRWFGSIGPYHISHEITDDNYMGIELNPPFIEHTVLNVGKYAQELLEDDRGYTLAIIIPVWSKPHILDDIPSEWVTHIVDLCKDEHQYRVGSYYQIPRGREFVSLCDSSVIILQNKLGSEMYPVPEDFNDQLIEAFQSY